MTCTCGHPDVAHHLTPRGHRTWCSVWTWPDPRCPCTHFKETDGNND